jgi:hypothetical protein
VVFGTDGLAGLQENLATAEAGVLDKPALAGFFVSARSTLGTRMYRGTDPRVANTLRSHPWDSNSPLEAVVDGWTV